MTILNVQRSDLGSNYFDVTQDERVLASLDARSEKSGVFEFHGHTYETAREAGWGDFVLSGPDGEICRATKPSAMFRSFNVHYAKHEWVLEACSMLGESFELCHGDQVIGHFDAKGFFSRRGEVEFVVELPLPVQCFLIWLVLLMWRRSDEANAIPTVPVG